jgi:hypothetical protein
LPRGATERDIEAAYRRLAKLVHPDKGGDCLSFACLKFIVEVLLHRRAEYDTRGRAAFASEWPGAPAQDEPAAAGSSSTSGPAQELIVFSPVNEEAVRKFVALAASRELYHGKYSFAELCQAQLDRAVKVAGRPGLWTADVFAPAKKPSELGLEAGLEIRYGSAHARIAGQQAGWLNGISVFGFPKIVRLIVRADSRCRIIDIANSHFVMAAQLAAQHQIVVPCIREVVQAREAVFAALGARLNLSRDELKKLLLSLLYGARLVYQDDFLEELAAEVGALAAAVAERYPAHIAQLKDTGRAPVAVK